MTLRCSAVSFFSSSSPRENDGLRRFWFEIATLVAVEPFFLRRDPGFAGGFLPFIRRLTSVLSCTGSSLPPPMKTHIEPAPSASAATTIKTILTLLFIVHPLP